MNAARWESVKHLLYEAMQLRAGERTRFLDEACSSDVSLRAELESLLNAEENVRASFLQAPPLDSTLMSRDVLGTGGNAMLEPGQIFAERFELIRKLGEGGMGQVWLAEQTASVRRLVAVKLIKGGMYDESVMKRFQAERQSLAMMDHPAIAKVFDAGATPQGQPYFVMEYVPGLPITEYCDRKKLKIADRLELFIQACEAVQHAHQKAVIHRDLKPANILVVEVDGKPVPRVIDFGLAKATTPQVDGATLFTQVGYFVGTPGYMSPEQADPNANDIDTRTDVYSLGAVLYVLLAGSQPLDMKPGEKPPLHELLRRLREEDPPSPSVRLSSDWQTSTTVAEARSTEPKQLARLLRGDLDWITMKALEKDRSRRYSTPSGLAADIRRYLKHEAIVARPASTGYRLRKHVRRHRVAVVVAVGLVMLLAAFSIMQTVQVRRITRERDRANRERDRATRITDFMTNMFKVSDPSEARGKNVTAREILDRASTDMGKGLAKDPEVQAQMMQVMAATYSNLGLYARADELARHALNARQGLLGPDDPKTLESMSQLGWVLTREGHFGEAEDLERKALAGELRVLGPEDQLTLASMDFLAQIQLNQGHFEEAEKLERKIVEVASRKLGPENSRTLRSSTNLGAALMSEAHYAEAELVLRHAVDVDRRVFGPDDPTTSAAMGILAINLQYQGRFAEAEQLNRAVLAITGRVLGPQHQQTAAVMQNLSSVLIAEGHLSEAEKMEREVLGIWSRTLGPEHPDTLISKSNLVETLIREGKLEESERLIRETLAVQVRILTPGEPSLLVSQDNLASLLLKEGKYKEAEKIAHQILEIEMRSLGPQHPYTLDALRLLGTAMAQTNRYDEAAKLFQDVVGKDNNSGGQGNHFGVWYAFACVAAAANRPDESIQYLREAIHRGYKDADGMAADDDLKNLHGNARFESLITELRGPSATARLH
jgi:eukaryotic-like serine/threonine-protein kinase